MVTVSEIEMEQLSETEGSIRFARELQNFTTCAIVGIIQFWHGVRAYTHCAHRAHRPNAIFSGDLKQIAQHTRWL